MANTAIALWVIQTYAMDLARVFPILEICSPVMRCGKTRLLEVLEFLCLSARSTANITQAALFRIIARDKPTLLMDEVDTYLVTKDEIRGILNAGYLWGGSISRCVGKDWEPRDFDVWGPKAIALIGRLPPTLRDRSITIDLKRKAHEKIEELRRDKPPPELFVIRRKIVRWVNDHTTGLNSWDPFLPPPLNDRQKDNWRFLFVIARECGKEAFEKTWEASLVLSQANVAVDDSDRIQLLSDLRDLFEELGAEALPTRRILEKLVSLEDRPWAESSRGKPISAVGLAKLLKPFGIRPKQRWFPEEEQNLNGYAKEDFDETFDRYLPQQGGSVEFQAKKGPESARKALFLTAMKRKYIELQERLRRAEEAGLDPDDSPIDPRQENEEGIGGEL